MHVIVIGAGVGGLAVARRLLADGHTVRVFEKAPERRTGGAALTIFGNGAAVLSDLGIDLEGVGGRIDRIDARTASGRLRTSMDLAHTAETFGFPTRSISRRRIVDLLSDGLPDDLIRYGTGCVGVTHDADSATARFDDGTTAVGDLVVGADGIHSVVRRQLWGDDTVRPASFGTWQGLSPIDIDITDTTLHYMITGKEGACGLIPAGPGLLQWWFDVRWKPTDPRPDAPLDMLRRRFGHWAYPVPEVLASATEDDLDFFGHRWNKVRRVWGEGRVTLLGDSAHTMPPTLGQGANQTFEDAWVLGRELADESRSVPDRLRAYELARYPRVNLVSQMAKRNPANIRIPPILGRRVPETAQTKLLGRFSNRLNEGPLPTGGRVPSDAARA